MVQCTACVSASTAVHGTPPRCMLFEPKTETELGVIVVGLNPGLASHSEINHYRRIGMTYDATVTYLRHNMQDISFYARMNRFISAAGFNGSVHWTELAKCQLTSEFTVVPDEMIRTCISKHLKKEIEIFPTKWPVVAVGRRAFAALSILCSDRPVIGIPHPTGFGAAHLFRSMFSNGDDRPLSLNATIVEKISVALDEKLAVWLSVENLAVQPPN